MDGGFATGLEKAGDCVREGASDDAADADATGKYVEPGEVTGCREEAHGVAPLGCCDDTACCEEGNAGNLSLALVAAIRVVRPGTAPTFLLAAACSTRAQRAELFCFADLGKRLRLELEDRMVVLEPDTGIPNDLP